MDDIFTHNELAAGCPKGGPETVRLPLENERFKFLHGAWYKNDRSNQ